MTTPTKKLKKPVKLSAWELAELDKSQPYVPGRGIPLDEAMRRAKERYKAWQKIPKTQTA